MGSRILLRRLDALVTTADDNGRGIFGGFGGRAAVAAGRHQNELLAEDPDQESMVPGAGSLVDGSDMKPSPMFPPRNGPRKP